MGVDRTTLSGTQTFHRRPAVSTRVHPGAARIARSPAQTLEARLGSHATQILIARAASQTKEETEEKKRPSITATAPTSVQHSKSTRLPLSVSKQRDPAELEAEGAARKGIRIQQGAAIQRSADTSVAHVDQLHLQRKAAAPISAPHADAATQRTIISEVVDISSGSFNPSERVKGEIEAQQHKGLIVRVAARGLAGEGQVKVKVDSTNKYDSMTRGSIPLLNPWTQQLGGMYLNFNVKNNAATGYASFKPGGGDTNDWLQALKKNSSMLGGLGLKVENLPTPVNKFESGKLTLGVTNLKVEVGGFLDAKFNVLVENANQPKIGASADVNIKGAVKGTLHL